MFAGVALLVASFSIYNTFSILVAQRSRESALLRALGAVSLLLTPLVARGQPSGVLTLGRASRSRPFTRQDIILAIGRVGKAAGLFVPSGTMANQIALRTLAGPGRLVVAGRRQHVVMSEYGPRAPMTNLPIGYYVLSESLTIPPIR